MEQPIWFVSWVRFLVPRNFGVWEVLWIELSNLPLGKTLRPRNRWFQMFNQKKRVLSMTVPFLRCSTQKKTSMMEFRECFVNWRTQNKFYKNVFLISRISYLTQSDKIFLSLWQFSGSRLARGHRMDGSIFHSPAPSCNKRASFHFAQILVTFHPNGCYSISQSQHCYVLLLLFFQFWTYMALALKDCQPMFFCWLLNIKHHPFGTFFSAMMCEAFDLHPWPSLTM